VHRNIALQNALSLRYSFVLLNVYRFTENPIIMSHATVQKSTSRNPNVG